jgi:spoIIIJ-associated protein
MTDQDISPGQQGSPAAPEGSENAVSARDVTQDVSVEVSDDVTSSDLSRDAAPSDAGSSDAGSSDVEPDPTTSPATTSRTSATSSTSLLEREGEVAADFLEQLLDIADLDGDIDVDVDGDRAAVAIVDSEEGRVSRRLVGADGQVLEALQELTRLAVQASTGERSRLMLDVAGYRAERRAAVVTIAQGVIATVKSTDEKMAMEPMTAFERKVVHDEVLAAGLVSESEGVEPQRHVVVLPA